MGGVISGEQWLLELAGKGKAQQPIAAALLRMQVVVERRHGHTLVLGYEYTRRAIVTAAAWGKIAAVTVECQGCHCQARLTEWQRLSLMSVEDAKQTAHEGFQRGLREKTLYLLPCPGEQYATDLLDSLGLPREDDHAD